MLRFFPVACLVTVWTLPAQQIVEIRTDHPAATVSSPSETVTSTGAVTAASTGLQESLGAAAWYSIDPLNPTEFINNIVIVGVAPSGFGSLRHFQRPALSSLPYSLVSAVELVGGIVPSGVAYDSVTDVLYVIDRVTKSVLSANWDGGAALSTVGLTTWFDASSFVPSGSVAVPALALLGGDDYYFGTLPKERVVAAQAVRVSPRPTDLSLVSGTPTYVVVDIATQNTSIPGPVYPDGNTFELDQASFREGATSVAIRVGEGHLNNYTLIRTDSGAVLGTAAQLITDREVTIPSSVPLEVGVIYGVYRAGQANDVHEQRCMVRFGVPGELTAFGSVEMGELQFSGPFRAGDVLQVSCPITAAAQTPILVASAVTFGGGTAASGYPIIPVGPNQFLIDTNNTFPLQLRLVEGTVGSWIVYDGIAVPNTPGAAGQVFVMQAVAVDGNSGVYFSDILGGMVLPSQ